MKFYDFLTFFFAACKLVCFNCVTARVAGNWCGQIIIHHDLTQRGYANRSIIIGYYHNTIILLSWHSHWTNVVHHYSKGIVNIGDIDMLVLVFIANCTITIRHNPEKFAQKAMVIKCWKIVHYYSSSINDNWSLVPGIWVFIQRWVMHDWIWLQHTA